jgi:asparagine synthase (glutamine-hydrolysing)
MCGIAGVYLREQPADLAMVRSMCERIIHRGPDDAGYHVDGGCGFGMRRLSIIDLHSGHQPITNEDHSVWVVFNGEIYNYQELRQDLIRQGHRFTTNSDTETLVHLYEQEGPEGLKKLRGMFAIAMWDARHRKLMLARDRFGKKPLYYAVLPSGVYFGSELKCLREAGVPLDPDTEALKLYFQFSYIPDPWSPYRDIRKVAPGSWMVFHENGKVESERYWSFPRPAEYASPGLSEREIQERMVSVFDESVKLRMIADVPLGAFLSGGIDSSSVVASMALQSNVPVKTFSIGFEEAEYNELPAARLVAEQYKTDHHEILVRPDSIDLVSRLVKHFDEPFGDSSAIPTFLVSEFAARYVKVALTGDGGDELFAGYESFFRVDELRKFDRIPKFARRVVSALADRLPYSAYGKNYLRMISRPSALQRYFEVNYTPYFLRCNLLQSEWMLPADAAFLHKTFEHCLLAGDVDVLTQALYFEATAKLSGDMLVKVDRMSMANSLEVRSPMLDHKLAEVAAQIPHGWNMRGGVGKQVLRNALGGRLPAKLLQLPKKGFAVPLRHWFRSSLREFLHDHLTGGRFFNRGIVSPEFVKQLLREHDAKRRDNSHWLWMLLMLELWFREDEAEASVEAQACANLTTLS